jgi:Raf kinase inhibitor-like YbhB/YbcL family protein
MAELTLASQAFAEGEAIPARYSCEGDDVSPPLEWRGEPAATRSLALIVDDPDAPVGVFVHWLAWGIDPRRGALAEGESGAVEGTNGFGTIGYRGPCPPPGHGPHRYFFRIYAVDGELDVAPGAEREALERTMEGRIVAEATLIGTYER